MKGSQEPRIKIEPDRCSSDGEDAAVLMKEYGYVLDEWQQMILHCWLGKDRDGNYTTTSAGLSIPRQSGKNVCLEAREFFGIVINGERILHTAHQVRTSKKSFRRLASMFTDKAHPEITDIVRNIRYTNGEECIELDNGGSIEFSARSRQAARGFDGISLVVYDEAQELLDEQVEAIMATLSASTTGTRQILYTGTPPYPGCPGNVFKRIRKACLTNAGKKDAWHEWSIEAESANDIDVADKSLWYLTNPALGTRLTEDFTETEMTTLSRDGFARERLGWWAPDVSVVEDYAIPADVWDACASDTEKPEGKTAYGVKFSVDGAEVSLCGAVIPKEGPARISLIQSAPTGQGIQWLADWLNERYGKACCVVVDGKNGVDALIDKIAPVWKRKGSIVRPFVREVIASVSMLTDALNEKSITWYRPQSALRESAVTATKRKIMGGWGFGGDASTPVEACALAFWGAKTSKFDPSRKMRIG